MRGKQCPKALWLYKHRPELRPPASVAQQAIFDSGTAVGLLGSMAQRGGGRGFEQARLPFLVFYVRPTALVRKRVRIQDPIIL